MKKKRIIIIVSSALIAAVIVSISVYLGVFFHKTMTFDELKVVMTSNKSDDVSCRPTGYIKSGLGENYLLYFNQLPSGASEIYVVKRKSLFGRFDIGRFMIYDHFVSEEEVGINRSYINTEGEKRSVLYIYGINSFDMDIAYVTLKDSKGGFTQIENIFPREAESSNADENTPQPFGAGILLNSPDMELVSFVAVNRGNEMKEREIVYAYPAPQE